MFKHIILSFLMLLLLQQTRLSAQSFCATPATSANMSHNAAISQASNNSNSFYAPKTLRVYYHVIRRSNGTGGYTVPQVNQSLSILQNDFDDHNIFFFWNGCIDYIDNTNFFNNAPTNGIFNINNHADGIDIYLFPPTNPSAGGRANGVGESSEFWVSGTWSGAGGGPVGLTSIISHEMGHVLFLWHTHHGSSFESSECAELVNGSNCNNCGDYVCDTPADPFLGFNVNSNCVWTGSGVDPNGQPYNPDERIIMAYTTPSCMSYFTPGQGRRAHEAIETLPFLQNCLISSGAPLDFSMSTNCNFGEYVVSGSASIQAQGAVHSWKLMQTTVPNSTVGGVQVGSTQFGNNYNFNGLLSSNFYYVEHTTERPNCNIIVTKKVVPYHQIASVFDFEDENGTLKTEFCHGEDIYLDGSASYGETAYELYASRRPVGSTGSFDYVQNVPWVTNAQVGILNISELFANQGTFFEPDYEYRIGLAIQNVPACVNWIVSEKSFTIKCCENFITGSFNLENIYEGNNNITIVATDYDTYREISANHQWFVYTSPSPNGPFTLTQTVNFPILKILGSKELCYLVIHSVTTACGRVCYAQQYCYNGGTCAVCGPIDCNLPSTFCFPPTNPTGKCLPFFPEEQELLTWDAIPGANQYTVEITFNDPDCCRARYAAGTYTYTALNNYLDLGTVPQPVWNCLSWRVGYACGNGNIAWSERQCFAGCEFGERSQEDSPATLSATLMPNPAHEEVTVTFDADFTGQVQLMDMYGRVLITQLVETTRQTPLQIDHLAPGIYWVVASNKTGVAQYKLVKNRL